MKLRNYLNPILSMMIATAIMVSGSSNALSQDPDSTRQKLVEAQSQIDVLKAQLKSERDARALLTTLSNNQSGRFPLATSDNLRLPKPPVTWSTAAQSGQSPLRNDNRLFAVGQHWPAVTRAQNESMKRISDLARSIRESDDESEKEDLKDDLKAELEKQYDAYLEGLVTPLRKMEERLEKLRSEYDKRKSARDELVKLRLDSIWYEANGMSWPDTGGGVNRIRSTNLNPFFTKPRVPQPLRVKDSEMEARPPASRRSK